MVAKVTAPNRGAQQASPAGYAFDLAYAVELRDYFQSGPARAGMRSSFGAMLAQLEGCQAGVGSVDSWDPYAEVIDRLGRLAVVDRTLRRLLPTDALVLRRYYDYPSPVEADWSDFGTGIVAGGGILGGLAALVPLTRAARDLRDEMVADLGERRAERCSREEAAQRRRERRDELVTMFWTEAAARDKAAAQHDRLVARLDRWQAQANAGEELTPRQERALREGDARLLDLSRRVRAGDEWLGTLLSAYRRDSTMHATIAAMASADAEVSVTDAVRWMLRRKKGDEERVRFVATAKAQARSMCRAAHSAYKLARGCARCERGAYRDGAIAWRMRQEAGNVS